MKTRWQNFLWGGGRGVGHEKTVNVLCWPQHRSGLGLVSVKVKCVVLRLKRIKQYLEREGGG